MREMPVKQKLYFFKHKQFDYLWFSGYLHIKKNIVHPYYSTAEETWKRSNALKTFENNDPRTMWNGIKTQTTRATPHRSVRTEPSQTPWTTNLVSLMNSNAEWEMSELKEELTLIIQYHQVRRTLRINITKATGADGLSARTLKTCVEQLDGVLRYLQSPPPVVPICLKSTTIVPAPHQLPYSLPSLQ